LLTSRRFIFSLWALLALAALIVANQTWYWVSYLFGETTKSLSATGASAWPVVNGASWFWLIGLAAMLFTRNRVRSVFAAILALVTATELVAFFSMIGVGVSPTLNSQVEKASGLAGGTGGGLSSAITVANANQAMPKLFLGLAILLLMLQAVAVWASLSWKTTGKADRYAKPHKPGKSAQKAASGEQTKDDAISLWDSQR